MAKFVLLCVLAAISSVDITSGQRQYQAYTVQDIADLQNAVLYETFDYFYFSQERQLTTVFERLSNIESRLARVMDALGFVEEEEEPDRGDAIQPPTDPPTRRPTEPPRDPPTQPPVVRPQPNLNPVRPKKPKKKPQNRPQPSPPQRPTTRPTTKPTTAPTTKPTTTPPTTRPTTQATTTAAPTPPPNPTSCNEILQRGQWSPTQAIYSIDPLSKKKLVEVVCQKEIQPDGTEKMYTVVGHSQMRAKKVTGFENPGEFRLRPTYNATIKLLKAITQASTACSQSIEYRCRGAVLMTASRDGGTYGFWMDINGEVVESWGGAPTNSRMCACGVEGTCEKGLSCNCDSNSKTFVTDSGDLTEKERLPVMDVRLGDTGGKKETGYIRLGPLICE